jgi:hypothetical protein
MLTSNQTETKTIRMEKKYEVVLTFVMPNQQEVFAIWDIGLYGVLRRKERFQSFIMDGEKKWIRCGSDQCLCGNL